MAGFGPRGLSADEASALADRFQAELHRCGGRRLVERARIGDVLGEQGFQQTGCTSTECAVQTGRLLGVERMFVGTVSQVGRTWTVDLREVEVGSGVIVRETTLDRTGSVDDLLVSGMAELARRAVPGCADSSTTPPVPPKPDSAKPPAEEAAPVVEPALPVQIAFVSPVSVPPSRRVAGLAVDVVYGRLDRLVGLQVGLANRVDSAATGLQAGLYQQSGENQGIQAGVVNSTVRLKGIQAGAVNSVGLSLGVQAGAVNVADTLRGGQVGILNFAGPCRGLQLGLLNTWIGSDGKSRRFPLLGCLF